MEAEEAEEGSAETSQVPVMTVVVVLDISCMVVESGIGIASRGLGSVRRGLNGRAKVVV